MPLHNEISIKIDGRTISGGWSVIRGMVTVVTSTGASKTTKVGGSDPEILARIMLRELFQDGKA
jgi:hypothetical protein